MVSSGQSLRELGIKAQAVGRRPQPEEAVEHHLRDEDDLEELLVQAQAARDVAALHRAARGIVVVRAIAAGRLRFVEPGADLLQPPARHRPGRPS